MDNDEEKSGTITFDCKALSDVQIGRECSLCPAVMQEGLSLYGQLI